MEHSTNDPGGAAAALEPKFGPGTIETYTGEAYDFRNPDPATVHLADIAHALSNMCRFAGHTRKFYSVAEHCVFVANILRAEGATEGWQRIGLLHDAHEAYVWDCPRPFKPLLGEQFKVMAQNADVAICQALHVSTPELFHAACIKVADDRALVTERRQLMTAGPDLWEPGYEDVEPATELLENPSTVWGYTRTPLGLRPEYAKMVFLEEAKRLGVES